MPIHDDFIPTFLIPQDGVNIDVSITSTPSRVADQGFTYNQAGFTYNQAGVQYGGVYNANENIVPMVSLAAQETPHITGFMDLFTTVSPAPPPSSNAGLLMGILGLTYPN